MHVGYVCVSDLVYIYMHVRVHICAPDYNKLPSIIMASLLYNSNMYIGLF